MYASLRTRQYVYIAVPLFLLSLFALHWHHTRLQSPVADHWDVFGSPIPPTDDLSVIPPPLHLVHGLSNVLVPTSIPGGAFVHGFTMFDELYLREGTLYILTDDASSFPPRENLLSSGASMENPPMEPTTEHLRYITPLEAKQILGEHATRIKGFTMILWEHQQFMSHLYHWWGEIILGAWRVYAHLSLRKGARDLPLPTLFILPHVKAGGWRDKAGVDGPYMRAAFPDAPIESAEYWEDLKKLNTTVVFERAMLADRYAAHRHPFGTRWFKMIAGAMNVTVPTDFWAPVRESMVKNIVGHVPVTKSRKPMVTYISRQRTGRRLLAADHDLLVSSLQELQNEGICDVTVAVMEHMTLKQQVALIASSTVLVGVHGNGLTNQLWMPPSARSTTFEIFYPPGYTFDYEILARNMGHRHYGVHNDTLVTYDAGTYHPSVEFPNGFHGDAIPVYGPAIARVIRERLQGTKV